MPIGFPEDLRSPRGMWGYRTWRWDLDSRPDYSAESLLLGLDVTEKLSMRLPPVGPIASPLNRSRSQPAQVKVAPISIAGTENFTFHCPVVKLDSKGMDGRSGTDLCLFMKIFVVFPPRYRTQERETEHRVAED